MREKGTKMQDNPPTTPELAPATATDTAAAPPATEPAPAEGAERIPGPEELLRAAELKAAEHHDAWLRAKAETENVRKRGLEEVAKASKYAAEKFAQAMLPVKDSLEASLGADNATLETLRNGVELTLKQLVQAFSGAGIVEIDPAGQKFDPNHHQALSTVEAEGEPNRVVTVLQKGYLLNERVLRPALVVVSKAREAAPGA